MCLREDGRPVLTDMGGHRELLLPQLRDTVGSESFMTRNSELGCCSVSELRG
jgi:hypothetical protein